MKPLKIKFIHYLLFEIAAQMFAVIIKVDGGFLAVTIYTRNIDGCFVWTDYLD